MRRRPEYMKTIAEWLLARKGFFTLDQVIRETGIPRLNARTVLNRFVSGKLVNKYYKEGVYESKCRRGEVVPQAYFLVADRAGLKGRISPRQREGTASDRMWKVLRYEKLITVRDLVKLAEATKENAKHFLKTLRRAGIADLAGKGGPGAQWVLIRDLGAKRPYLGKESQLRKKKV